MRELRRKGKFVLTVMRNSLHIRNGGIKMDFEKTLNNIAENGKRAIKNIKEGIEQLLEPADTESKEQEQDSSKEDSEQ